jgi:hypothetical protein
MKNHPMIGTNDLLLDMVILFFYNRKFVRRGTYSLRKNRMTPSILQQDDLQLLTQSSINKQKLIDETVRKVREAESKAQDLSVNIQYVSFFCVYLFF